MNSWGYLSLDATLLPEALRKANYHTAVVGKWHLGLEQPNRPNDRSFDHFRGYLGDMMDDYYNHRRHSINYMRHNEDEVDPKGHATDLFTQWACEYLQERAIAKQPFFLYLAYNAPHTPIQPPEDWLEKVKQREPEMSLQRAKLVALIEHMDDGIGKVMKTLAETDLDSNTLVIFTSDNGGQLERRCKQRSLARRKTKHVRRRLESTHVRRLAKSHQARESFDRRCPHDGSVSNRMRSRRR